MNMSESRWDEGREKRDMPTNKPTVSDAVKHMQARRKIMELTYIEKMQIQKQQRLWKMSDDVAWGNSYCDYFDTHGKQRIRVQVQEMLDYIRGENKRGYYPTTTELFAKFYGKREDKAVAERLREAFKDRSEKAREDMVVLGLQGYDAQIKSTIAHIDRLLLAMEHRGKMDVREWEGQRIWRVV